MNMKTQSTSSRRGQKTMLARSNTPAEQGPAFQIRSSQNPEAHSMQCSVSRQRKSPTSVTRRILVSVGLRLALLVCVQGSNLPPKPAKVSVSIIRNDRKVIEQLLLNPLDGQKDPANIICDFAGTSLVETMKKMVETIGDYDHDDWVKRPLLKKVNDAMRHWSIHVAVDDDVAVFKFTSSENLTVKEGVVTNWDAPSRFLRNGNRPFRMYMNWCLDEGELIFHMSGCSHFNDRKQYFAAPKMECGKSAYTKEIKSDTDLEDFLQDVIGSSLPGKPFIDYMVARAAFEKCKAWSDAADARALRGANK